MSTPSVPSAIPEIITLHHKDFEKDFRNIAPPKKETKATLAQLRSERRCHRCGIAGSGLQTCAKCQFTQYCSRKCQVADWPIHKTKCRTPLVTNGSRGEEYPDLAMKFATRLPACQVLIHLLQTYALSLHEDLSLAQTRMLRVTVSTQPADSMTWLMREGDRSGLEVMLKFVKLESVPLSPDPARLIEMAEANIKVGGRCTIIPLLFTNGVKEFFHPTYMMESAFDAATKRQPMVYRTRLTGDNEVPFGPEALQDAMNNFVLMDKKNQFKLRAIPK